MVSGIAKHVVMNGEGAFFIFLSLLVVLAFLCFSIFVTSHFTVVSFNGSGFTGRGSYCPYMVGV